MSDNGVKLYDSNSEGTGKTDNPEVVSADPFVSEIFFSAEPSTEINSLRTDGRT